MNKYQRLQKSLCYDFADESLLEQALTHRSHGQKNNERLEFLGDALLSAAMAKTLYFKFPDEKEGNLSRLRSQMVKGETLSEIAREYDLSDVLIMGSGELKSGGFLRDSVLADAVEAIIGAIYLDGGIDKAEAFVQRIFQQRLEKISISRDLKDPKTRLQEWLQAKRLPLPVYAIVRTKGKSHNQQFTVSCATKLLAEKPEATANSRRQAEQKAAEKVLQIIEAEESLV